MRYRARTFAAALLFSSAVACGPNDPTAPPAPLETTGSVCPTCTGDAGGGGSSAMGSDAGTDGASQETGASQDGGPWQDAGRPSPDLGIVVADLPATPCQKTSATPVTVMESEPLLITYDQAGVVGSRRFGLDPNTLSMLTFDAEGSNPSAILSGILSAKPTSDGQVVTLTSDGQALALRFYDSFGRAIGPDAELTREAAGTPALAAGPGAVLALWQSNDALHGRLATKDGKLGVSVEFGVGSCGMSNCTARAVHNGRGFTVAWSRVAQDERSRTSWADVGTDGKVNFVKPVLLADGFHRVIDVALVGSSYALLVGEGYPTRTPVIVFLDAYGNVTPPARRLLGSTEAWGVAATTAGLGVAARLSDGRAAVRSLTVAGDAPEPWVCLDDSEPDIGFAAHAAIYGEPAGYGFVVRMTDGSAAHLRTDGHGAPR